VRTGLLEVLKLELCGKLGRLKTNGDRPHLYLTFDSANAKMMTMREIWSISDAKQPNFACSHGKEHLQKKDFFRYLNKVSGLFHYGDITRSFTKKWIAHYDDGKSELNANVRLAALYNAPPQQPEMKTVEPIIVLGPEELGTYGSRERFIWHDLLKCAELPHERG
jgi:hypothetical protein